MANRGRRLSARYGIAAALGTAAIYLALFGAGTGNRPLLARGGALLVLAIASVVGLGVVSAWRGRRPIWIHGSAQVVSVSAPPGSPGHGPGELRLLVHAPGVPAVATSVRDPRVPVEKWPEPGDRVPVTVDYRDPRRVRVEWDLVAGPVAEPARQPEEELADEFADEFTLTEEELTGLIADVDPPVPLRRILPIEDEPSGHVARYLFPTEQYRGEWPRHIVWLLRPYVVVLGLAVVGTVAVRREVAPERLTEAIATICVVGAVVSLDALLAWFFGRFVLTNKRLMLVEGAMRRRVSSMGLPRITELRLEQSVAGHLAGYGDFVIEGARRFTRMRRIADLPNPNELYLRLIEELYEPEAVRAQIGHGYDDYDE